MLKRPKSIVPPASSPEIIRLPLAPSAKSSYRFYNSSLQNVYNSCGLPTETPPANLHSILSSTYSVSFSQRSIWKHTIHKPQRTKSPETQPLSMPFMKHASLDKNRHTSEDNPQKQARKTQPSPSSNQLIVPSSVDLSDIAEDETKKRRRDL